MAKVNHNNFLDTIRDLSEDGARRKIMHLRTDGDALSGQNFHIYGRELKNFGTCGYLGLEMDPRLKHAACEYAEKYGTQFSISRTYLALDANAHLEELIGQMYGLPVLVYSSTSVAHTSIIPSLIHPGQAIVLDQQVHMSVQNAVQQVKSRNVTVEMIKHSKLDMLEHHLREMENKYEKVWYMVDGVYSMYGDTAPFSELKLLQEKYPYLYVYIDDAHGMSWHGENGTGYAYNHFFPNDRCVLVSTLAKGYGATGGLGVFPTQEMYQAVQNFGGPLAYSHPLAPPMAGVAIASALIHLSPEMREIQAELADRIDYCNQCLAQTDLPLVSYPDTPIFFIGMGKPEAGYNMVHRVLGEGFYLNPAIFPTVPIKNTGLRFTITRHQSKEDIKALIDVINHHYPLALEESGSSDAEVRRAFRMASGEDALSAVKKRVAQQALTLKYSRHIEDFDRDKWNACLARRGSFDYDAVKAMADILRGNELPEDNANFHFFAVEDANGSPVLLTYMTDALYKDDMLAPPYVSAKVEEKRRALKNPYYLTSETLALGSLLTEGQHLYIDRSRPNWKQAMRLFLDKVGELAEQDNINAVMLRDFAPDSEFRDYMISEGYFRMELPNSNIVEDMQWNNFDELVESVGRKSRRNLKYEVQPFLDIYETEIRDSLTEEETERFYQMYLAVKNRNLGLNYFDYPRKLFRSMSQQPNWEFVCLHLKAEQDYFKGRPAAIIAAYKGEGHYSPTVIGMDYTHAQEYQIYRQMLYRTLERARQLGYTRAYLGLTADTDKYKFGARPMPRVGYMQARDTFSFEAIEAIANSLQTKE